MKQFLMRFYFLIIILFLYIPIGVLVVLSFNDSMSRAVWGGFTLKWYISLFARSPILAALGNTLAIGFLSSILATIIAVMAAAGITAMDKKRGALLLGLGNIPMMNADIVTGIILMLAFSRVFHLGYSSLLLAHITFNIPYALMAILPKMRNVDQSLYEAARDLGADRLTAFFKVILPEIFPAVMGGFFIALTMSMDDFVVTYFTKGAGVDTLSTMIYGELKRGIKPEMYALSTVVFLAVVLVLAAVNLLPESKGGKGSARVQKSY